MYSIYKRLKQFEKNDVCTQQLNELFGNKETVLESKRYLVIEARAIVPVFTISWYICHSWGCGDSKLGTVSWAQAATDMHIHSWL